MRIRARKVAALLMAVTLMSVSGNPAITPAVYAEDTVGVAEEGVPAETVPTEAPAVEESAPVAVTEAPPATEAPVVTEAPAATEAPATEPQTAAQTEASTQATEAAAPGTEAPSSETQAATDSTEAKATEASTQAATEAAQSESKAKETEKESEEPGKSREFAADAFKGKITVKLPKGKGISEKSVLVCEGTTYADDKGNKGKVNKQILGKQRVITGGRFCTIYLKNGDETISLPEGTQITYKRSDGLGLNLEPLRQLKTHIFNVSGDSAKEISADISLNKDLAVTGFSFSAPKNMKTFGLIAEANRANDGAAVSRGSVISSIGEAANFAAVAESVSGTVQDDSISNSTDLLNALAGYSTTLANATSGSDATVVTVYTDGDGNVQTNADDPQDPMRAVLGDGGKIDVSGRMVVLNYVVTNPGAGHVSLPHYDITFDGQTIDKDAAPEQGGRFVVTVTAIQTGTDGNFALQPYSGEVSVAKRAVGTYLVPNGTISTGGRLVGAAYARSVNIAADRRLIKATVNGGSSEPEVPETEAKDKDETEAETEAETESENLTEASGDVMLMAAAEEEDATLSAAADEIPIATKEEYAKGGLNEYSGEYVVDIAKTENIDTPSPLAGATLKLYNKSELVYQFVSNSQTGERKTVKIPANTELYSWNSSASAEPISSYFKVLGENGQFLNEVEYVVKETAIPADHAKAWDFTITYQPNGNVDGETVTITGVTLTGSTSDVNKSKVSPDGNNNHIWIYDARITENSKIINVAVNDSAVTESSASGYYLSDVPIEIATVSAEGEEEKILASFSSIEGATPVDLSTLPMPTDDTPLKYVIREASVAPGYIFDKNSFTKDDSQAVSFVSNLSFEIDKDGNISGLPANKNLTFKQKKFSFTVEAVDAEQTTDHVSGVKYTLKIGNNELDPVDYLIDGEAPGSETATTNNKVTITLTDSGAKKLYPNSATEPADFTLEWGADVPAGYQYQNNTTPAAVTIDVAQSTQNIQVQMVPLWKFTVDARFETATGAFVTGVPFTLQTGSTTLSTSDYQIDSDAGNSTLGKEATIKLTASGREKVAGTKSLSITWGNAPAGYTYATKPDGAVITDGTIVSSKVEAVLNPWTFYVVAREDGSSANISGAEFILRLSNGTILNRGTDFRDVALTTTSGNVTIVLTQAGAEAVRTVMAQSGSLRVVAQSAPDNYNIKGGSFTANVNQNGQTIIIPLEKVPEGHKGTLTVTKQTLLAASAGGGFYYEPNLAGHTYYVALFSDAGLNNRVGAVQPVHVPYSGYRSDNSSSYPAARFENLNQGQYYYLAETDANGNVTTPDGVSQIEFAANGNVGLQGSGQGAGVMLPVASADNVGSVVLSNTYARATGMVSATFQVKLNVVDENNKPLPSALTAEFTIRGGNGTHLSKSRTIQLSNESTKTRKDIPYRWDIKYGDTLNVAAEMISLKDASGANVMKNYDLVDPANKYKVLAKGTAIQTYTRRKYYKPLKQGTRNETTLEYTLKRVQTSKEIAELKLTKAVTYKKTPIRVNGTYYIGIFEDAAHKKILYKKAMALANASSMTSTLKINLYKLAAPHTITLYFAEVDKNGNVVTSGKKTGYDISLNKTQVTLSPTNADESVILTNDVRTGSVAAANLTNPSSGFAGDASALAEAQALSNNETVKSKPTGDDTPFEPFALATGISAAAIFLLLALLAARKKLWVK